MDSFGFIDSSGIIKQDRFFGVGLLVMNNVGAINDKLAKNYQTAQNIIKNNKSSIIANYLSQGKKDEVINMLRGNKRFEMKFDNLRPSVRPYYEKMIDSFFADRQNRFSVMVIDKENPTFNGSFINDVWEAYTGYSASLVIREMRNLENDRLCLIVDEITKPCHKPRSLEDTILSKLQSKARREDKISFDNVFGVLSIESHSNLLMQLTDVFLGSVMYDFKKKNGLISKTVEKRKEYLVNKIREILGTDSLAKDFTKHNPAYFSVFEAKWNNTNTSQ